MYAEDLENYKREMTPLLQAKHYHERVNENDMTIHSWGTMALMCPKCYHIEKYKLEINGKISISRNDQNPIDVLPNLCPIYANENDCPDCKSDYRRIEVDPNIANTISILNKKGFYTVYCCEGHDKDPAYIYFRHKHVMELYAHTIPITWFIDFDDLRHGKFIIRSESANYVEGMLDIYEWAKTLPDITYGFCFYEEDIIDDSDIPWTMG